MKRGRIKKKWSEEGKLWGREDAKEKAEKEWKRLKKNLKIEERSKINERKERIYKRMREYS